MPSNPRFTPTDLTPFSGAGQPVEKGAEVFIRMATTGIDGLPVPFKRAMGNRPGDVDGCARVTEPPPSHRDTLCPTHMLERMARTGDERPIPPRLLPELPLEPSLRLAAGHEVNSLTIQGDFSDAHLQGLVVEESHVVRSSFIAADLGRLTLVDVLVEGSDFSGADMEEASFTRVMFKGCRMSGARLPRTQMHDVTFHDVKLDRGDFYSAHLTKTRFFDCDLTGADVAKTKLAGARFHGSVLLDLKGGEYLRNVVIDTAQVLPLAAGVFAGLNIRIDDDRDAPNP
jgi:hypothetical protein